MFILTTGNNRYVFTWYSPLEGPTWARPSTTTIFQPVVFTRRSRAESTRLDLQKLRSDVEIVSIITPLQEN